MAKCLVGPRGSPLQGKAFVRATSLGCRSDRFRPSEGLRLNLPIHRLLHG